MRVNLGIVPLVAIILAAFPGTGQTALIYANSVVSFSGVTHSGNLTGEQDLDHATFSNGSSAIVEFAQNFADVSGMAGVGGQAIGWWFDWTQGYEIPGAGSNQYDHIMLSYSGSHGLDVDAIRVDTGSAVARVPESGTMVLLGAGLISLAGWGRKKYRK